MKFRNYCLVVIGDTKDVLSEIIKISDNKPNVLDAKGILIATFSSVVEPQEVTDYFKINKRNFLVFDLNVNNSGFYIEKKDIHDGLFGFLNQYTDEILKRKTEDLLSTIDIELTSTTVESKVKKTKKRDVISIDEIKKMTPQEKNELMNKLIDKGVNNLSEYDKKILSLLSV